MITPCIFLRLITLPTLPAEGEDGHNWVFSADQLEDDGGGAYLIMCPPSI